MKYKSIRKKIINTISFICILVFVFSFSYLFFVVRPANEKNVIYLIRQNVETKAQEVNQWIEKRVVEYRTLAAIPAIKSMDVREITPIINEVNNRYTFNDQTMETFSFIGKNGFCWINAAATEDLIRYDDYINIYSSDQEFLIGNPVIDSQNRPVVVFYYSITGYTDKKESLIASAVPLTRIEETINTIQLFNSKTWLINKDHEILSTDVDYLNTKYIDTDILKDIDISSITTSTILDVDANKGKSKLIITPISSYSDWAIMTLVSLSDINKTIDDILFSSCIIFILLILLILYLGNYLSKSIMIPMQTLRSCMLKAQQGDLKSYYPVSEIKDEISEVGSAYNTMLDDLSDSFDKIIYEQQKKNEAEMNILQEQIKPHFLYNTLENIRWMAKKYNADDVEGAITTLSQYFRLSLNHGEQEVSLKQEFQHTKSYLDIQKIRYKEKLSYMIELDPEIADFKICKITIQPLVENAIKHGIKNKNMNGTVTISGKCVDNMIIIEVEDDGVGMNQKTLQEIKNNLTDDNSSHYGLRNVYRRLQHYYGDKVSMDIESFETIGTFITIKIERQQHV